MEKNYANFTTAVNENLYSALSNGMSNRNEIAAQEIANKVVDILTEKYGYPIRRISMVAKKLLSITTTHVRAHKRKAKKDYSRGRYYE